MDFSDVASRRRLPRVHPGEILRDEFLTPMRISVYELAKAIKVPRSRANDIVLGRRGITTDTAMRLGRYFGMSPEFWINLRAGMAKLAPDNGVHVCLRATSTTEVDAFHAAALEAGGVSDGAPGIRPHDRVKYYAAFVIDPDGNRVEAVTFPADDSN